MPRKLNVKALEREGAKEAIQQGLKTLSAAEQQTVLEDALNEVSKDAGVLAANTVFGAVRHPWNQQNLEGYSTALPGTRRKDLEDEYVDKKELLADIDLQLTAYESWKALEPKLIELEEKEGKLGKLRAEHKKVAEHLAQLWKSLGLPMSPRSTGDYLKGLIACAEFRVRMAGNDALFNETLQGFLKNYYFTTNKLVDFSVAWRATSFARVAVGHKLAAALMLTDPKDLEVKAPWETWILEIPEGFYPFEISPSMIKEGLDKGKVDFDLRGDEKRGDERQGQVRAILCNGTTPERLLVEMFNHFFCMNVSKDAPTKKGASVQLALESYVKGVCLAFQSRKHVKESTWARREYSHAQRGPGEPVGARHYLLSTPIKVDFRQAVRDLLTGRKRNGVFTSQWIVRGHWRDQACGPGMKDHRETWIKPYWKGPEEARILLRGYDLE